VTSPPEPWQLDIPFKALVVSSIGEATASYGFIPTEIQPNLLQFDNGRAVLYVTHHPRDGEVSIDFGRSGTDERYSFLLYIRSRAPKDEVAVHSDSCWTADEVQAQLSRLKRALVEYGVPILEGDDRTYEWMAGIRWWTGPSDPPG
jgi:hypothetical protein